MIAHMFCIVKTGRLLVMTLGTHHPNQEHEEDESSDGAEQCEHARINLAPAAKEMLGRWHKERSGRHVSSP